MKSLPTACTLSLTVTPHSGANHMHSLRVATPQIPSIHEETLTFVHS